MGGSRGPSHAERMLAEENRQKLARQEEKLASQRKAVEARGRGYSALRSAGGMAFRKGAFKHLTASAGRMRGK